ncbi:hypothetical protein DDI_1023 [Dickeya dianthicola RNS04.9]|nr:hypothetical protein DDI_1023 [Dickeya dianthicola RNS04.9]
MLIVYWISATVFQKSDLPLTLVTTTAKDYNTRPHVRAPLER